MTSHVQAMKMLISEQLSQQRYDRAAEMLQELLPLLQPDEVHGCWADIQKAYFMHGDIKRALDAAQQRLAIRPFDAVGWTQEYSNYHRYLGLYDRAREITQEISDPAVRDRDLSWHEFRWGSLRRAFELQEHGRDDWGWVHVLVPDHMSRWHGQHCENLVVLGEAGAGDAILYSRWLPELRQRCKKLWYLAKPDLADMLRRNFDVTVVVDPKELPVQDAAAVPLLSVPYELGINSITNTAYLSADPAWVKYYAVDLPKKHRPRIGICWSGQSQHAENHLRSIPQSQLFHSLQDLGDIMNLQQGSVAVPGMINPSIEFWEQTLALIHSCDAVVSVDTSVAHAAAALGVPTVVATNMACYYCWPLSQHPRASEWYPRAWSVTQSQVNCWKDVLEKVQNHVAEILHNQTR